MKLHYKFTLVFTVLFLVAAIMLSVPVNILVWHELEKGQLDKELTMTEHVADDIANPLLNNDIITVQEFIDSVRTQNQGIHYIYVVGFDGCLAAHTFSAGFPLDFVTANPVPEGEAHTIKLLSVGGDPIQEIGVRVLEGTNAKIYIGYSRMRFLETVRNTTTMILIIIALVLLGGISITFFLTRNIIRPIEVLAGGTERIRRGDFDFQLEVTSDDEVGVLTDSFNLMTADLRLTHQSLRESEGRYRSLYEDAPAAYFSVRVEGVIHQCNKKAARITGIPVEKLIGMKVIDLYADMPEGKARVKTAFSRFIAGEPVLSEELLLQHSDGSRRWVDLSINSIRDEEGKLIEIHSVVIDITERKQAEMKVAQIQKQIEFILGATKTGLDIIDSDFNLRYIDPEWQKIYGNPQGRKCYEYFMDRTEKCPGCGIPKALASKTPVISEEILVREGNRPIQVTTIPFQEETGEWLVAEVNVDITELKHAQEELKKHRDHFQELVAVRTADLKETNENLRQEIAERKRVEAALLQKQEDLKTAYEEITATEEELQRNYDELSKNEQALRQSEEKFHAMADFTYDWEYWQGPDKSLIYISPSCEFLTGYTQQEFLADPQLLVEIVHPDDRTFVVEHNSYAWDHPQTPLSVDFRIICRDGTVRWIAHTCQQITEPDGKHLGRRVSNRDITGRKQAEEKLKRFNEELERRVRERTEQINASLEENVILLREVHHRVKNNLQIIISLVNLQMRQIDDKRLKQVMAETQNRVRAMSLVHEKLYQSEDISHIDLANYTRFLVSQLFSFYGINSRQVDLNVDIGKIMVSINTSIPLGLIINELTSNSLKHAFPNGRTGTLSITVREVEKTLHLSVKDDGAGVPADFDWRNAESLGLRLVISLVEQLDGTIELDRTAGTAFTIVVKETE